MRRCGPDPTVHLGCSRPDDPLAEKPISFAPPAGHQNKRASHATADAARPLQVACVAEEIGVAHALRRHYCRPVVTRAICRSFPYRALPTALR
jgi:hypothetical protein